MEIDGLGKRCALTRCGRLDYLPITCNLCNQSFCDEHHKPQLHNCIALPNACAPVHSNDVNNTCPQCGAPLNGISLGEHLKVCVVRKFRVDPRCVLCNKRDPLAVKCPECENLFCVQHRLPEDHQCIALQSSKSSKSSESSRKIKFKLSIPSRKFMNSSQQPIGDNRIDSQDRINCIVYFAFTENENENFSFSPRFMFFSLKWSAGKVIDDIMKRVSNLPKPKSNNRFVLYSIKANGAGVNLLPHVTPIRDLPKGTLTNGDSIVFSDQPNGLPQDWIDALKPKSSTSSRRNWKKQSNGSKNSGKCILV